MSKRVEVAGYSPMMNETEASTVIEISGTPPDFGNDWRVAGWKYYQEQATLITDALIDSLPGGTLHALTVRLLEHRVNVLRIKESNHE